MTIQPLNNRTAQLSTILHRWDNWRWCPHCPLSSPTCYLKLCCILQCRLSSGCS